MTYLSLLDTLSLIVQRFPLDFNDNYRESVKAKQLYEQLEFWRKEEEKHAVPVPKPHSA